MGVKSRVVGFVIVTQFVLVVAVFAHAIPPSGTWPAPERATLPRHSA